MTDTDSCGSGVVAVVVVVVVFVGLLDPIGNRPALRRETCVYSVRGRVCKKKVVLLDAEIECNAAGDASQSVNQHTQEPTIHSKPRLQLR